MKVDPRWMVRGWAIKEKLEKKKVGKAEGKQSGSTLGEAWQGKRRTVTVGGMGFGFRPILNNDCTRQDLEDEIEWIHDTLIDILNAHTRVVTIYARSNRW